MAVYVPKVRSPGTNLSDIRGSASEFGGGAHKLQAIAEIHISSSSFPLWIGDKNITIYLSNLLNKLP